MNEGAGEGEGANEGEGTGSDPFDLDGFWARVNSQKQYPPMAVKQKSQGTATLSISLDAQGELLSLTIISSTGNPMLDKAALNAVQASCPYLNASGKPITFNTTVVFRLK